MASKSPRRPAAPRAPAALPSIIEALAEPALFKGLLDGPSWQPWRAFLAALFGMPMDDAALALYRHHTGRTAAPTAPFREAALVVGRRGGKSRVLSIVAAFLATVPDYSMHTAPGETPVIAVIAADRKQARVILGYITGLLHSVPALHAMVADELAESVRLSNGVSIEIHTGSIGAPRGRTFIAVLADEVAFWSSGDSANPDKEVLAAVRPGLASIPTSMLLMASSPYARRGVLFETFSRYHGKDDAPVLVWRGTTLEMNSALDRRFVDEAFEADPESADAEYGANFRSDITAFIGRDAVEAVVADGQLELPPAAGINYAAFVDPSGGSADSMTLAVAHVGSDGVAVLDAIRERRPPFSPEDVTTEFADLLRSYKITRVCGDAYAGEWPRERFATHGISYEVSPRNKNSIYQDFLPALNGRRVRLLDQPRLIGQLCNLERRTARGGRDSIDHGPGQHDDVANCVCGALTLVINDRRPALIPQSALLVDDKPVELGFVQEFFTALWVGIDGTAAHATFAYSEFSEPKLAIVDFDTAPWSAAVPGAIAAGLDAFCEAASEHNARCRERGVSVFLLAPEQATELCAEAMRRVFVPRLDRADAAWRRIDVDTIDAALLRDPAKLLLDASAHVAAGSVKLAGTALSRAQGSPLLGVLALKPGEAVDNDPLRVALLVGIAQLSPAPSHTPPAIPGARMTFG